MKILKMGKKRVFEMDDETRNSFIRDHARILADLQMTVEFLEMAKIRYGRDNLGFCSEADTHIRFLKNGECALKEMYNKIRELY